MSLGDYLEPLLRGCVVTLEVTVLAAALGSVLAIVAGLGRIARSRAIRFVSGVYVEIGRGTSALVQLFFFFYALPLVGFTLTPLLAGVIALGLNFGAYGAEIVRGAVRSVPPGQIEAAIALNMRPALRMRRVILPQAFVAMLPPFGNLMIELLKGTALVSLITLSDLTFEGQLLRASTGETLTVFSLVLALYFVMAYALTLAVRAIERRAGRGLNVGREGLRAS